MFEKMPKGTTIHSKALRITSLIFFILSLLMALIIANGLIQGNSFWMYRAENYENMMIQRVFAWVKMDFIILSLMFYSLLLLIDKFHRRFKKGNFQNKDNKNRYFQMPNKNCREGNDSNKSKHIFAKITLFGIGLVNVILTYLQGLPNVNLVTITFHVVFAVFLCLGKEWTRTLYIFGAGLAIIVISAFYGNERYNNIMLIVSQASAVATLLLLLFNKKIDEYFEFRKKASLVANRVSS